MNECFVSFFFFFFLIVGCTYPSVTKSKISCLTYDMRISQYDTIDILEQHLKSLFISELTRKHFVK